MAIDGRLLQSRMTDATLLPNVARDQKTSEPDSTRKVARQFESMFIQMMLRSMRQTHMAENSLFDETKVEQYRDMYDGHLSSKLAEGGGIGLADMITRQLTPGGVIPSSSGASTYVGSAGVSAIAAPQPQLAVAATTALSARPSFEAPSQAMEALATLFGGDAPVPFIAPELPTDHSANSGSVGKQSQWSSPEEFVRELWPHAQQAAQRIGADPRALVAQAALETGWGRHVMHGADGRSSFNLFGIKADSSWSGNKVNVPTLEFEDGAMRKRVANFRSYESVGQAFDDYVSFLQSNPRYGEALDAAPNANRYLRELQEAGYATDPNYARKINNVINGSVFKDQLTELKKIDVMPLTPEKATKSADDLQVRAIAPVSIST